MQARKKLGNTSRVKAVAAFQSAGHEFHIAGCGGCVVVGMPARSHHEILAVQGPLVADFPNIESKNNANGCKAGIFGPETVTAHYFETVLQRRRSAETGAALQIKTTVEMLRPLSA